jgi:hypothetical protein
MTNTTSITVKAHSSSGLTLAELAAFVEDATRQKVDPTTKLKVRATFLGSGVKAISVTGQPRDSAQRI